MTSMFSTPSSRRALLGGAAAAGLTGAALASSPATAATAAKLAARGYQVGAFFLTVNGIPGESTDYDHAGAIELGDFMFGDEIAVDVTKGSSGAGAGKPTAEPFSFTARASKASPLLFLASVSGKKIKSMQLDVRGTPQAGGESVDFLTILLETCYISSYKVAMSQGDDGGRDDVEVVYGKITYTYRYLNDSDTPVPVKVGWDFIKNVAIT